MSELGGEEGFSEIKYRLFALFPHDFCDSFRAVVNAKNIEFHSWSAPPTSSRVSLVSAVPTLLTNASPESRMQPTASEIK